MLSLSCLLTLMITWIDLKGHCKHIIKLRDHPAQVCGGHYRADTTGMTESAQGQVRQLTGLQGMKPESTEGFMRTTRSTTNCLFDKDELFSHVLPRHKMMHVCSPRRWTWAWCTSPPWCSPGSSSPSSLWRRSFRMPFSSGGSTATEGLGKNTFSAFLWHPF